MKPIIALAILLMCPFTAYGGTPSDETPLDLFPVRTDRENEQLLLEATKLYESITSDVKLFTDRDDPKSLGRLKPLKISEAYVHVLQLQRLAELLVLRGETTGVDLARRAESLRRSVTETVKDYLALPDKQRQIALSYGTAQKESRERTRRLPKIEQLVEKEKWQEANDEIYEIIDFLSSRAVWYDQKQALALMNPFVTLRGKISIGFSEMAEKRGVESLALLRREATPHLEELVTLAQDLAAGKQTASAPQGAEGLRTFLDQWRAAQLQTMRCHGIDWARMGKSGRTPPPELAELQAQWQTFAESVRPAILFWLRAEVERTAGAAARKLYLELLPVLAEIAVETDNDIFLAALADPLAELAAKDADFGDEVAAYRLATGDWLRWRKRRALARLSAVEQETPTLDELILAAALPSETAPGIVRRNARDMQGAQLTAEAPATIEGLAAGLIGKRVRVGKLAGLPISRPMATTQYSNRCFGTLALPTEAGDHAQALREELLVTDNEPPLTLEAAVALQRAMRGDFVQGECEIIHVALESLTYRMATLRETAQRIAALDAIPVEQFDYLALDQVLVRCELQPIWLLNENDFLPFSAAKQEEPTP